MNRVMPALLAVADLLTPIKLFDVAGAAIKRLPDQAGPSGIIAIKQYRPDIAEAIAQGEYVFMQRTGRSAGFRRRSIQLRYHRLLTVERP